MSFDIIKKETRVARMISWLAGIQTAITDFLPGGKTRTKLEAVALEMEQQDYQVYRAIQKAIPISIYRAFDFSSLPAVRAAGTVRFQANSPAANSITIPRGSTVATVETATNQEKIYETTEEIILTQGETSAIAPIVAVSPGRSSNTGIGTITVIKTSIPGIDSVTNEVALTNGADQEQESSRAQRFREYISGIKRGTAEAIEFGASTATLYDQDGNIVERVVQSRVVDMPDGTAGFADCYVFNGHGETSEALVAEAQKIIDGYVDVDKKIPGYKAAGVVVTVMAATETIQDVDITVATLPGAKIDVVEQRVRDAISHYLASLGIGDALIYNEIVERSMNVEGAYNVDLTVPTDDIVPGMGEVLILGTLTTTVT